MEITYSKVSNPRWAKADHSVITCLVKFNHLKQEVEFSANPTDCEPHGRQIFAECLDGKYGPIGEYTTVDAHDQATALAHVPQVMFSEAWPEIIEFIDEANRENSSGTIRGQVLVWSSMVELLIGRLIDTFLIEHSIAKKLSESTGPLSTFSAQINVAFGLGLISKKEHLTCDNIRIIRNQFAHNWSSKLDDKKLRKALKSLYETDHSTSFEWIEDIQFLIKQIYSGSCAKIAFRLAERQKDGKKSRRVELRDVDQ